MGSRVSRYEDWSIHRRNYCGNGDKGPLSSCAGQALIRKARAHSAHRALWRVSRELPRWTAYYTDSLEDASKPRLGWPVPAMSCRPCTRPSRPSEYPGASSTRRAQSQGHSAGSGGVSMANKVQKPSRERGLLSGGLLALSVALALVASLLYAQPAIRAYWWMAAAAAQLH